ncbi:MAG TPA: triacylglycerol lipase [Aquabacterium sp.]|uniref:lipase family alpha/beta hydrolase n=1 Tax=Aquabacterium sp. TaxID=1872578 RepID=UPI002E2EDE19|nr:triacylglycerol lipase [Aquabacterium sp.]HEX5356917.1 triacylglycerol lipase [Aquabacterium sp.]
MHFLRTILFAAVGAISALSSLSVQAATTTTYAATKYPIVLVHGFLGFKDVLGVDYFYQVPDALRKNGAKVYVAAVSEVNASSVRGEQLLQQMKQWAAADGVKKFNLIGHSQGGPTSRYVAGVAPELVASVTTMAGPTVMTDAQAAESNITAFVANYASMVKFAGSFVAWISGHQDLPQDASALNLQTELADFARRFPAGLPARYCGQGANLVNGIYYFSATGQGVKTNAWDVSDLAMQQTSEPSDGAVIACAAHLGKVIRDDYPWNHIDEMNHVFGLIGKGAPDPVQFYVSQANRLKLLGR